MTGLKSVLARTAIGASVLTFVAAGLAAFLMYPAIKSPSPARYPRPSNQAESNRQDLGYLKAALHEVDRSFSPVEWAVFDQQIDELKRRADHLDGAALEMGAAKAVASAHNGHTNLLGAARGLTLNSYPLRFYWFADGLRIVKTDQDHADILGAKVLAVGGRAPGELVGQAAAFIGGAPSLVHEIAPYILESPEALNAIGAQTSSSSADLTLELADGAIIKRRLLADSMPATGPAPATAKMTLQFDPRELYWPRRDLSPFAMPANAAYPQPVRDGRRWSHVLDRRPIAVSLRNPNLFYWSTYLAGGRVLYVQINVTMDQPGREPLKAFLARTLADTAGTKPRYAIVDLRWNPGGSYQHAADFARDLPAHIPRDGKVFILTSGNTFSAGIVTTARLKYFAGGRGEIVGEPIGDYSQFWAEAATRIVLPNSRLRIGYATGYHDWQHGCSWRQIFSCYPGNFARGVAAGNLRPAMPVSWLFSDYLAGRDSAVEKIMQTIAVSP